MFYSYDLYLHFFVYSYTTLIYLLTGFTPKYLTFNEEARLLVDLVFGLHSFYLKKFILSASSADDYVRAKIGAPQPFMRLFSVLLN